MRDFLDNLIDRHTDAVPQFKPRLPSMFEPEVSHGGLDVGVPDNNAHEIEETVSGPPVRKKEIAPSHGEPMDAPPFAEITDRHIDAVPQFKPRLPSMFEPEVSHGGLDVGVPDNNAREIEETVSGPSVRIKKIAPSHGEPMDAPPFAEVTTPTTFPTVMQAMQPKAAPVVGSHQQKRAPEATVNEGPKHSVLQKEEGRARKNPPVPIIPARREEEATDGYPTQTASSKERMARVRHAHQEARTEHTSPHLQAAVEEQISVKEGLNQPVFPLPARETPTLPPPSQGGGRVGVRALKQGLLEPSATLIAPVIPSVAEPESADSQPEPVINVSIGRIEVRASMPPQKQTPKPESRTPVMGLEEYLRRRSGGQDR